MHETRSVDLSNCDREPIHIPGSIQPHGFLLACDNYGQTVLRHSANAQAMLGVGSAINGLALQSIIGDRAAHDVRNAVATTRNPERPALLFAIAAGEAGRLFDIAVHRHLSTVIVEFEPHDPKVRQPLSLAREMIGRISGVTDLAVMMRDTARLIHGALGYDRVMVYRFGHDGAGQVIAESKRSDLESFYGQYFPATDIPAQARALYMRNTIRVISDAHFERIAICPVVDASGEPLDLSFSHLRSVSPIHCEYLKNMGVSASMSISIIVDGQLWGLIACHHYSPRVLSMAERVAAEMFGAFFSLHLHALQEKTKLEMASRARRSLDAFLSLASHRGDIADLLAENLPKFRELMPCDGIGLWVEGIWTTSGSAPPASAVPALARFASGVADGRIWATHALSQKLPSAEAYCQEAAGVLIVPLSQIPRDYLFFFRREVVETLDWAGNPDKVYEIGPLGDRLTPRRSFAIWKELVRQQAKPWTDADREIADAVRAALVEVVLRHNELLAEERGKADVRQRMLNEELNHRVKNILAIIKSLVAHPVAEGRSLRDYVGSLKGRIQALAFAHDQVVRGDGGGMLADLLNAELTPYRSQQATISLSGPQVWLDARAFSVMALVLHELSTNAAKYGALSAEGGRLAVHWEVTEGEDCVIEWQERGGPAPGRITRQGFGTVLIDRSIPYDLGGRSDVRFAPEGLVARFVLPSRHVSLVADTPAADPEAVEVLVATDEKSRLKDIEVLLVEDQMLIALDVEAMLLESGIGDVTTAASAASALSRLERIAPDVAVLDVNLGTGTSLPVAEELFRRGVPFVFATGYGETGIIPQGFGPVPIVRKPYDRDALLAALLQVMAPTDADA
ncbi:HWE histidine kinase domain-containing protein [Rhizobium sp. RU20A]|uniref:HWE histidine kinase domain-containing protein n=1 Tax=Rhizobium sp. RU20A TaxID=1907412 RepID=UPI00122C3895|nr:HWE histidine kinase domain-containing protein [Rhizobium sp. RU20A]